MVSITDQELDATWRATTEAEIARDEWHADMNEAAAETTLERSAHNLVLMVLAMTGGIDYERMVDTDEYIDWQEDIEFIRHGGA